MTKATESTQPSASSGESSANKQASQPPLQLLDKAIDDVCLLLYPDNPDNITSREMLNTFNPGLIELIETHTKRATLERAIDCYQAVQIYTDPSHQKMSPFTRLKEADNFINKEIATLKAELEKL